MTSHVRHSERASVISDCPVLDVFVVNAFVIHVSLVGCRESCTLPDPVRPACSSPVVDGKQLLSSGSAQCKHP